jgi:hypothetical protein
MSFDGLAANTSGWSTGPKARGTGSIGCAARIQHSLPIGRYAMATAEHREPYESRGSRTVLGAPEGETPSGDSSTMVLAAPKRHFRSAPMNGHRQTGPVGSVGVNKRLMHRSNLTVYSITLSARARSVAGNSRPSSFAVLRLITSSKRTS